jgi:hypothetical protein
MIEAVNMPLEIGCRDEAEVSFARQEAPQSSDGSFHAALLPGTMGITEEGWEFQCLVDPVMRAGSGNLDRAISGVSA